MNELHLFFDTETSGFISKKLSFDNPKQAWIVQLGALLSTRDKIIDEVDILIKPNGRTMNSIAQQVHGITLEQAQDEGIEELEALEIFASLLDEYPKKICHNYDYDANFIDQLFRRHMDKLNDTQRSVYFINLPHVCTMKHAKVIEFCQLPNKWGKYKWPKLTELHTSLFGESFEGAHDAMADVIATRRCYYELSKRGII